MQAKGLSYNVAFLTNENLDRIREFNIFKHSDNLIFNGD